MNEPTIAQVDAAVRSVLKNLRGTDISDLGIFSGKLLCLKNVNTWPEKDIRVSPGTVVTPLAREEMKRLGITLRMVAGREIKAASGEWGFAIDTDSGIARALSRKLLEGERSWVRVGETAREAGEWVVADANRGAAVISAQASVACYLANRVDGVRAATVSDADAVSRAVEHLGMNLAVVEPMGQSIFGLFHLLQAFRSHGIPMRRAVVFAEESVHAHRRGDRPAYSDANSPEPAGLPLRCGRDHDAIGPGAWRGFEGGGRGRA